MHECLVCGSAATDRLVSRADVPIFQNGLLPSLDRARGAPTGQLDLWRCGLCGLVWNAAFDPALVAYDPTYDNAQHHSASFRDHLAGRIEDIANFVGDGRVEILELGCGQGDFLRDLAHRLGPARVDRAVGFDPAYDGREVDGVELHAQIFDMSAATAYDTNPDIVIIRHMIEHVPDPSRFIADLAGVLRRSKPIRLFVETPSADWIIRHRTFFDLYYEHRSKFSSTALAIMLHAGGFISEDLATCFGGQYLWARSCLWGEPPIDFADGERAFAAGWAHTVAQLARPVYLWGAGAKSTTFALFVDPDGTLLEGVVDINPAKQGHFVPRTGHPIVAPEALRLARPGAVLVLNGNYVEEIRRTLSDMGLHPDVRIVGDPGRSSGPL